MLQDFSFLSAVSVTSPTAGQKTFWQEVLKEQNQFYKTVIQKALAERKAVSGRELDEKIQRLVNTATQVCVKTAGQPAVRFTKVESDNYGNSCEWSVTVTTTADYKAVLNTRVNVGSLKSSSTQKETAS